MMNNQFTKIYFDAFKLMPKMSASAWKVYCSLARRVNVKRDDNLVWPSHDTIMKDTGIASKNTVKSAIKQLTKLGLLEKKNRNGTSNRYKLIFPEADWESKFEDDDY